MSALVRLYDDHYDYPEYTVQAAGLPPEPVPSDLPVDPYHMTPTA